MEFKEKRTLYFQKDGKLEKLCNCAEPPEVEGEVIKVKLSEENILKPFNIKFENGSTIKALVGEPEVEWRGKIHGMFWN